MLFNSRVHSIEHVEHTVDLAEKLTNYTWCRCQGFSLRGLLFLNDSSGPDGAQEYAVVIDNKDGTGKQIESITFSWCNTGKAIRYIEECISLAKGHEKPYGARHVPLNTDHNGPCHNCA